MSFFFLFWSTCKFSTSWTIMFFFSVLDKSDREKNPPPPPHGGFTPLKGIQDSLGFWIPPRGFRIPGTVFQILGQWNLDSNRKWDSGFLCTGSLIFHSSISGFRIPQAKFLGAMTFKLFKSRGSTDQGWGSKTAIKRTPFSELGLYHWLKQ